MTTRLFTESERRCLKTKSGSRFYSSEKVRHTASHTFPCKCRSGCLSSGSRSNWYPIPLNMLFGRLYEWIVNNPHCVPYQRSIRVLLYSRRAVSNHLEIKLAHQISSTCSISIVTLPNLVFLYWTKGSVSHKPVAAVVIPIDMVRQCTIHARTWYKE